MFFLSDFVHELAVVSGHTHDDNANGRNMRNMRADSPAATDGLDALGSQGLLHGGRDHFVAHDQLPALHLEALCDRGGGLLSSVSK